MTEHLSWMQALFHNRHPLAFTSAVCLLGCLFPFVWVTLIFVFATSLMVSVFVPTVRREIILGFVLYGLSGGYYQQIRTAYEDQKLSLTEKVNLLRQVLNVENNLAEIELVGCADEQNYWSQY
jgi:hypothetical protein